jgi:hypothetical protein
LALSSSLINKTVQTRFIKKLKTLRYQITSLYVTSVA